MALHTTTAYSVESFRSASLDLKSTTAVEIVPARSGKRFMPLRAWIEFTAVTSITVGPTINMGNNASTYDNVHQGAAGTPASALIAVNKMIDLVLFVSGGRFTIDVGSTGIFVKLSTGATGSICAGRITIEGFYF